MTTKTEKIYSLQEAASILRCSGKTLIRKIKRNKFLGAVQDDPRCHYAIPDWAIENYLRNSAIRAVSMTKE